MTSSARLQTDSAAIHPHDMVLLKTSLYSLINWVFGAAPRVLVETSLRSLKTAGAVGLALPPVCNT